MSKKAINRDFGRKPELNSETEYKDYSAMMRANTNFSDPFHNLSKHSEFIKPYGDSNDYNAMEAFKPQNVNQKKPLGQPIIPVDNGCNGAVMYGEVNGARTSTYTVKFGESVNLSIGGHDGNGNPWQNVLWSSVGDLTNRGILSGSSYTAPSGSEVTGIDSCFGFDINLTGANQCGEANVIIHVDPPEAQQLGTISGPDSIFVSANYSVTGGTEPYKWSLSCGSIDTNGIVQDLTGCCGTGTLIVEDACGLQSTKTVIFPIGVWVLFSSIAYCSIPSTMFTRILPNGQKVEINLNGQFASCGTPCGDAYGCPSACNDADAIAVLSSLCDTCLPPDGKYGFCHVIVSKRVYNWSCP